MFAPFIYINPMNTLFKTVTDSSASQRSDEKIVAFQHSEVTEQMIFIQNLELEMFIGVLDGEKEDKQRVIVNAELSVIPSANWQEDNVKHVVSYATIIEEIKSLADQGHINLVETFAEMIIEKCFAHEPVMMASVSVEKPDIMEGTTSVGVQVSRSKY